MAQQRKARLWGFNTSSNLMSLRDCVSTQPGLVNGYYFGQIVCEKLAEATTTNDAVGGATSDAG